MMLQKALLTPLGRNTEKGRIRSNNWVFFFFLLLIRKEGQSSRRGSKSGSVKIPEKRENEQDNHLKLSTSNPIEISSPKKERQTNLEASSPKNSLRDSGSSLTASTRSMNRTEEAEEISESEFKHDSSGDELDEGLFKDIGSPVALAKLEKLKKDEEKLRSQQEQVRKGKMLLRKEKEELLKTIRKSTPPGTPSFQDSEGESFDEVGASEEEDGAKSRQRKGSLVISFIFFADRRKEIIEW